METRGYWVKVVKFVGVTVLVSSLLLLGALRSGEKRAEQTRAKRSPATAGGAAQLSRPTVDSKWTEAYGKLPLSFEENQGQTAREVRYVSHGSRYGLFLTHQEAVLALRPDMPQGLSPLHRTATRRALPAAHQMTVVRMHLEGANPEPRIAGADQLPGKTNYFIGNDPRKWHTDVPSYASVKYSGVYPGVDLVFYGNQRRLEYDFVVAPGADPKAIALRVDGARKMRINSRGDLVLSVPGGEVELQKPIVYQNVKGERREIASKYAIEENHRVTFSVASYDRSEPLILDPALNYATYLGGTGNDSGTGIAVDSQGNAYVVGDTTSTDFPGATGSISAANAKGAVFVSKINPTGTQLLYSSYLAGTGLFGDFGIGIALDPTGNIYVTGETFSTDFPTTASNALKPGPNAGAANGTSFISKINPGVTGPSSLVYSSYLGGTALSSSGDFGGAIAADASGNAYVAGYTASMPGTTMANFPVTAANAYQTTLGGSFGNAFLTKIDTTKSGNASLIYSTYLGGTGANAASSGLFFGDAAFGVALDSASNAYLVGTTTSTDFPTTTSGFQTKTSPPPAVARGTVFVSRIDTTKMGSASLIYSTYLGGNTSDFGTAIALGPSNVAYVTGTTKSAAFPTFPAGAYQACFATGSAFIGLIDTGQIGSTSLKYSTCLGSGLTTGFGIRADAAGNAYVGGGTSSSTFPVTSDAFQSAFVAGAAGEGFFSKLNPGGNGAKDLVYSTFFGGKGAPPAPDAVNAIAIDASNNAYLTGVTFSAASSFPVSTGAFQTALKGASDAFVASLASDFTVTAPATATVKAGSAVNFTVTVTPVGGFNSAVALTCTGAPALSTCTLAPASVTPAGGPVTSTVTVTTTALVVPPSRVPTPPLSMRQIVPILLAMLLLFLLPSVKRLRMRLGMVTAMILFVALAGCSGPPKPSTPKGTFNLTVTGTAGASTHSATVALTVN